MIQVPPALLVTKVIKAILVLLVPQAIREIQALLDLKAIKVILVLLAQQVLPALKEILVIRDNKEKLEPLQIKGSKVIQATLENKGYKGYKGYKVSKVIKAIKATLDNR